MDTDKTVPKYEDIAQLIDYTLLDSALTDDAAAEAYRKAADYQVRAVVVRPSDAEQALRWLEGSGVIVSGGVGFPDGTGTTGAKLWEGRDMLRRGAKELDFVLNVAKHRSRQFQYVETELMQIARSALESGAKLKVVLPNAWLDGDLHIIATKLAKRVEAAFVVVDSAPMIAVVEPVLKYRIELKAHVQSLAELQAAKAAGCTRFGTTRPDTILDEWKQELAALAAQQAGPAPVS